MRERWGRAAGWLAVASLVWLLAGLPAAVADDAWSAERLAAAAAEESGAVVAPESRGASGVVARAAERLFFPWRRASTPAGDERAGAEGAEPGAVGPPPAVAAKGEEPSPTAGSDPHSGSAGADAAGAEEAGLPQAHWEGVEALEVDTYEGESAASRETRKIARERIAQIRPGLTRHEQIRHWFGPPDHLQMQRSGQATWQYEGTHFLTSRVSMQQPSRWTRCWRSVGNFFGAMGRWMDRTFFYPPRQPRKHAKRDTPPVPAKAPVLFYDLRIAFSPDGVVDDLQFETREGEVALKP